MQGAANNNTCIGKEAGNSITTGVGNTMIGKGTDGSATVASQIAIGNAAVCGAAYAIAIGDNITNSTTETLIFGASGKIISSTDFDTGTVAWSQSSDIRKKRNIKDDDLGLDFINKLRPVTFQWKPQDEYPKEWNDYSEENTMDTDKVHHGLIAQEVKEALDECEVDTFKVWSEDSDGMQRLANGKLVIPLIKAVQELSNEVNELKKQLKEK